MAWDYRLRGWRRSYGGIAHGSIAHGSIAGRARSYGDFARAVAGRARSYGGFAGAVAGRARSYGQGIAGREGGGRAPMDAGL